MQHILHFDINGTITAFDSTDNFNKIQETSSQLSKSFYGKIYNGSWIMNNNCFDTIDSITYYQYLKNTTDDYKKLATEFTEKNNPGHSLNDICINLSQKPNFLFDSFVKLIKTFPNNKIIFRTFGRDREHVLNELVKINYTKKFIIGKMEQGVLIIGDNKYSEPNDINNVLLNNDSNFIIKEDYKYWMANNKDNNYGKLLFNSENHIQHFFDDNDCVASINGDINCPNNNRIHIINSFLARTNEDYFINLIDLPPIEKN